MKRYQKISNIAKHFDYTVTLMNNIQYDLTVILNNTLWFA